MLAAGGDPGRLHATLTSVRDQPSPAIEILVVGYDGGLELARSTAGDDTRVRFLAADDVAGARAAGLAKAKGEFVLVATAGDRYPANAIADLLPALLPGETLLLADTYDDAGPADLVVRPDLARFPYLGRLVLPRERAVALAASVPDADADAMPVALAALAAGFSSTPYPAWSDDRGPKPRLFTVRHDPLPGLAARVGADLASLLATEGAARQQRALGALAVLRPFLESAEGADDATWSQLVEHARVLLAEAADQLESLDLVPRVLALLAAADKRAELVAYAATVTERRSGEDVPTVVEDGQVRARLDVPLPPDALVVGEHESSLVAQARRLVLDDDVLRLEVFVGVRHTHQVDPPTVAARLVNGDASLGLHVRTGSDVAVTRWMDETEHDHDAGVVELSIGVQDLRPGAWEIELDWAAGGLRRSGLVTGVAATGSASRRPLAVAGHAVHLVAAHGRVALRVSDGVPEERPATLSRIELVGTELRITAAPDVDTVHLTGKGLAVEARSGAAGFWTVPLEADVWGQGVLPLPSGSYRLKFERAGKRVPVVPASTVVDRLPTEHRSDRHRLQMLLSGETVAIRLDAPLADDEVGIRSRWKQRAAYAQITEPLDDRLVYFQSFAGHGVGDHPLAIGAELARRRSDLDLRWVVADSSVPVPPGFSPLLVRSRDWYDVLARAKHLVVNVELERWFRRREGQQILQTFHGYPSKAMGLGLWRPRNLLPSQIEAQLDQSSRTWNNLLTPDVEMDQYYRRDYDYDGTILPLGYPRNDELVLPGRDDVRAAVRERLGIQPHQRALLYAPTWRDDQSTNYRAAQSVTHLDVEEASRGLGDDWVLLLRGHRFHAPSGTRGSRVIDVTEYPHINDLILAADAAVLDYSSLRFDFALVNRPMVFLVPDLDTYTDSTRGFLWDYRETTPGPLVASTAEVVAQLRDFDGLVSRHHADLVAFNARYNRLQDGHAAERVVDAFFSALLD